RFERQIAGDARDLGAPLVVRALPACLAAAALEALRDGALQIVDAGHLEPGEAAVRSEREARRLVRSAPAVGVGEMVFEAAVREPLEGLRSGVAAGDRKGPAGLGLFGERCGGEERSEAEGGEEGAGLEGHAPSLRDDDDRADHLAMLRAAIFRALEAERAG